MVRRLTAHFLLVVPFLVGCGNGPEAVNSKLGRLLEQNGFALYTPFRSNDYPGTVFALARDLHGDLTELTVSTYDRTFTDSVDPATLFQSQDIDFADELRDSFSLEGDIGVDLVSLMLNPEIATKYVESVTISLGDPKKSYQMTLGRLAEVRYDLRDSTKVVLTDWKERGQLNYAYIVMESLEVKGLKAEATLKKEFAGKVSFEQLEPAIKVGAKLSTAGESSFVVEHDAPILIGYKAITIPESLLRTEVSASELEGFETPTARQLNEMKTE